METAPKGWHASEAAAKQHLQPAIYIVISTKRNSIRPMSQVEGVYTTIEAAQAHRTTLEWTALTTALRGDFTKTNLGIAFIAGLKTQNFEIKTHYTDKVHAGPIHILISTQQVNGTSVVTIEDTYRNLFEGTTRTRSPISETGKSPKSLKKQTLLGSNYHNLIACYISGIMGKTTATSSGNGERGGTDQH
jgi:hypothetical protein